jgi:hypothetical protein
MPKTITKIAATITFFIVRAINETRPGSKSPERVLITRQAHCGLESYAGVDALAVAHGGQAIAIAELRKDHTACRYPIRIAEIFPMTPKTLKSQTTTATTTTTFRILFSVDCIGM